MVALAGMVDGVISPGEQIWSPGYMARTRSGKPILREHSPFSPRYFDAAQAITKSSNVYFATVADRMGKHNISAWFWRFGFGQRNGVDTPWQRPGLLPLPDTLAWIRPREPTWYPSDSWRMGIGQFCSASPLQTVSVPAAIANGGTIVQPYLWQKADRPAIEHLQLSPAALRSLRKGMEDVTVRGGTASKLILAGGQKVAAKTGTSEWGTRSSRSDDAKRNHNATWTPDHAWLVGYAPAEAPRVAFAIFIHSGTSGGRATSGVAKLVLERYFERYPVDHR
jgi:penicillin-binding protein 2